MEFTGLILPGGHSVPLVKITIKTEKGDLYFVSKASDEFTESFDMAGQVLAFTTMRDVGGECPTFQMTLAFGDKNLRSMLASNDLLIIEAAQAPFEDLEEIFYGLIDDVRINIGVSDNSAKNSATITGRGTQKAFVEFKLGIIPQSDVIVSSIGWLLAGSTSQIQQTTPGQAISIILDHYLTEKGLYYNYGDFTLKTLMARNLGNTTKYKLVDVSNLVRFEGSLWNFFQTLADQPFNELFWEIQNGKPTLICRKTPFNQTEWNALELVEIPLTDIEEISSGITDVETYTMYMVSCQSFFSANDPSSTLGVFPLWYPPYFHKFGVRVLNVYSLYAGYASKEDSAGSASVIRQYQIDLFNWNIKNSSMKNGYFKVKGSNKYKVGTKIAMSPTDGDPVEFYVESVKHDFTIYEGWNTTLQVTRGIDASKRFSPPWGAYEIYSPDVAAREGLMTQVGSVDESGNVNYDTSYRKDAPTSNGVPLYLQDDPSWTNDDWAGEMTVGQSGCGMTCISMIATWATGEQHLPSEIAILTNTEVGAWQFETIANSLDDNFNFTYQQGVSEIDMLYQIDEGGVGVVQIGSDRPTSGGGITGGHGPSHFVVITDYDVNDYSINDPNGDGQPCFWSRSDTSQCALSWHAFRITDINLKAANLKKQEQAKLSSNINIEDHQIEAYGVTPGREGEAYDRGRQGPGIMMIVDHFTWGSETSDVATLCAESSNVSSTYYITKTGKIYQFVPDYDTQYCNGHWDGPFSGCSMVMASLMEKYPGIGANAVSLSIEHEGIGGSGGDGLTDAQYKASLWLHNYLCDKHNIPKNGQYIIGHEEVTLAKTGDPGPTFPWEQLFSDLNS